MKGYKASLIALLAGLLIAVSVYGMPVKLALLSTANGVLYGLFPITWIIITAVFLFNLTVKSGQFEVIKHFMATITSDRRIQALLIAFSFGSFLEGTCGFGAPVAITAAMLVGLGFNPLYAAGICLIANTAPVAFGSIGIPITVASQVSSIPELAISQMIGRTLPLLSIFLLFYIVVLMSGFKKTIEVWPAVLVSGCSFAFLQWYSANYLGPALPDIIAGIGSIICLFICLKFWKPKTIWRFANEPEPTIQSDVSYSTGEILRAWSPFIVLTIMVAAVLGFAYILNDSGITITMASALANTGGLFPFFAPVLGWLGVFITGSDTSANALFGKLQSTTASSIGIDPVITVAANASGGVVGKMISPQSIAVAAAAGNLVGKESDLFRFTVKHSFIMLLFICFIVLAQAYLFSWMVPSNQLHTKNAAMSTPYPLVGFGYLVVLIVIVSAFVLFIKSRKHQRHYQTNSI